MKYKIGDRVKFKNGNGGYFNIENEGVIIDIIKDYYDIMCTHTEKSETPHFKQALAFAEKEIEDYA